MTNSPIKKSELGSGIYTIPDIHLILGYPKFKIRRYIRKYWDNVAKQLYRDTYSWEDKKNRKTVSFYVLIELYTFFQLLERGADTLTVATARTTMAKELNTPYPFANRDFLVDRNKIWYFADGVLVNADRTTQTNFVEIIESFATKIKYSDNLAQSYFPLGLDKNIEVNPHRQFGQPVITETNIITDTIYSMFEAGEKKEDLSKLYDITQEQINDVICFHNKAA